MRPVGKAGYVPGKTIGVAVVAEFSYWPEQVSSIERILVWPLEMPVKKKCDEML
jgi:hypothetical protein